MAYKKIPVQSGEIITSDWGNHVQTQYEEAEKLVNEVEQKLAAHQAETAQNHVHGLSPERVRAIYVSTDDPDDEIGEDGDIWIKYEE